MVDCKEPLILRNRIIVCVVLAVHERTYMYVHAVGALLYFFWGGGGGGHC